MEARIIRRDSDLRYVLTALCLLALIGTFAVPVLSPGLAAYTPAHGHFTLDGQTPANHVHPWDTEAGSAVSGSDSSAPSLDLVFTLASDGEAASGWASGTLVPDQLALAGASLVVATAPSVPPAPGSATYAAPSPPPRT